MITDIELFVAMRLGVSSDTINADQLEVIQRLKATADGLIDSYTANIPDDIKDQAIVLFCTYANDTSRDNTTANIFRLSGAQALVSDHHAPTIIGAEEE